MGANSAAKKAAIAARRPLIDDGRSDAHLPTSADMLVNPHSIKIFFTVAILTRRWLSPYINLSNMGKDMGDRHV
jgi:hypothetical protein